MPIKPGTCMRIKIFLPLVRGVSTVVLIEGLCRYTVEKLTGENPKQCPCQIQGLEDVAGVIGTLRHKLSLEFV